MVLLFLASTGTNPGLMALWDDEKERRREKGQSSQIENPQSQGKQ
jgi:DNA polymerase zeta